MIIKNLTELATTPMRRQALEIVEAGIARVLPATVMAASVKYLSPENVLRVNGESYATGRIFVIGFGKAAGLMAETLGRLVPPEKITAGVVICNSSNYRTRRIKVVAAGHPVPDERGIRAVREMLGLKSAYGIKEGDTVICLISGGGSAMTPCPVPGVTLEDKQAVTRLLLGCGADINEINTIRKHLSLTKGGQLGRFFAPARVVSLIISDVIGNDMSVIASGPTYPDRSTFDDACAVIDKYGLGLTAPAGVVGFLKGKSRETPDSLTNCHNHIIADLKMALEAMAEKARELGLKPVIATAGQKGETTAAARKRAGEIIDGRYRSYDAVLLGGETTPRLPADSGRGGRNQHYIAVTMLALAEYAGAWVAAASGTDGTDYLADTAGAVVDQQSLPDAIGRNIPVEAFIRRYDTNTLFREMGGSLIVTGATGTNVGDIVAYILA